LPAQSACGHVRELAGGLPAGRSSRARIGRNFADAAALSCSVSQAGYNTILNILAARVPAVVVPFASERETEQAALRAERLAARGFSNWSMKPI